MLPTTVPSNGHDPEYKDAQEVIDGDPEAWSQEEGGTPDIVTEFRKTEKKKRELIGQSEKILQMAKEDKGTIAEALDPQSSYQPGTYPGFDLLNPDPGFEWTGYVYKEAMGVTHPGNYCGRVERLRLDDIAYRFGPGTYYLRIEGNRGPNSIQIKFPNVSKEQVAFLRRRDPESWKQYQIEEEKPKIVEKSGQPDFFTQFLLNQQAESQKLMTTMLTTVLAKDNGASGDALMGAQKVGFDMGLASAKSEIATLKEIQAKLETEITDLKIERQELLQELGQLPSDNEEENDKSEQTPQTTVDRAMALGEKIVDMMGKKTEPEHKQLPPPVAIKKEVKVVDATDAIKQTIIDAFNGKSPSEIAAAAVQKVILKSPLKDLFFSMILGNPKDMIVNFLVTNYLPTAAPEMVNYVGEIVDSMKTLLQKK